MNKAVSRIVRKEKIDLRFLREAVHLAAAGSSRADLGDDVYKVDLPRDGRGKSKGYCALVGIQKGRKSVYVYLWAKNEFENVKKETIDDVKVVIHRLLGLEDSELEHLITNGDIVEIF